VGLLARQPERERRHSMGRTRIAMTPVPAAYVIRPSDIEMVFALAEEIDAPRSDFRWQTLGLYRR
jgi:hypothetical protein